MNRFLFLLVVLLLPGISHAATLYLSPSSGSYEIGKPFTVSVYVASPGQSVNAVSATISVPSDIFNIISASSVGSVANFWVTQPTVSGGMVSFEGVVLNPGYQGSGGKIASFMLSPKKAGTGSVSFANASVLANDGQGTNVLSGTTGGSFSVGAASTVVPTTPVSAPISAVPEPSAFPIQSSTHPEETKWYRLKTGLFSWVLPEGATATRLVLSSSPSALPSVEYVPAISEKTIDSLPEGISYLRVQHRVGGVWGGIGTYKIRVDSIPPEPFTITFPHGASGINPQPIILFNTLDELSGIESYDVRVGEGSILATAAPADSNPYTLPLQEPGAHVVAVTAFDQAGNTRTVTEGFFVEGIDPPKITHYEEHVKYGDLVKIRGLTYPNADVEVYVRRGSEILHMEPTRSNSLGDFATILTKKLEPGVYAVTARSTDARGARSPESEQVTISIDGGVLITLALFARDHGLVALVILLVLIGCIVIHFYGWRRIFTLTHHARNEHVAAAHLVHRAFSILRKDLQAHIRSIRAAGESRVLTKEEVAFLKEFEEELKDAETTIEAEVERRKKS